MCFEYCFVTDLQIVISKEYLGYSQYQEVGQIYFAQFLLQSGKRLPCLLLFLKEVDGQQIYYHLLSGRRIIKFCFIIHVISLFNGQFLNGFRFSFRNCFLFRISVLMMVLLFLDLVTDSFPLKFNLIKVVLIQFYFI